MKKILGIFLFLLMCAISLPAWADVLIVNVERQDLEITLSDFRIINCLSTCLFICIVWLLALSLYKRTHSKKQTSAFVLLSLLVNYLVLSLSEVLPGVFFNDIIKLYPNIEELYPTLSEVVSASIDDVDYLVLKMGWMLGGIFSVILISISLVFFKKTRRLSLYTFLSLIMSCLMIFCLMRYMLIIDKDAYEKAYNYAEDRIRTERRIERENWYKNHNHDDLGLL